MLKSLDTLTTIWTEPPTSFPFEAASYLNINKGCSKKSTPSSFLEGLQTRQPWPPPTPFEFMGSTHLLVCSTASCVFDCGKNKKVKIGGAELQPAPWPGLTYDQTTVNGMFPWPPPEKKVTAVHLFTNNTIFWNWDVCLSTASINEKVLSFACHEENHASRMLFLVGEARKYSRFVYHLSPLGISGCIIRMRACIFLDSSMAINLINLVVTLLRSYHSERCNCYKSKEPDLGTQLKISRSSSALVQDQNWRNLAYMAGHISSWYWATAMSSDGFLYALSGKAMVS